MSTTTVKAMRDAFIEVLFERMEENEDIFFLAADLGAPALDMIREAYPDRFINVGIAEQNLINVATGLALEGQTVYAYAIAPFISMRAYEQIRVNLSISSQIRPVNVNLIGVGGGVSYQVSGPTHHCLEDLSIMRLLPNITVCSPSDWKLAQGLVDYTIKTNGPKYIRFDGKPLPAIYNDVSQDILENGFCELVKGENVCLVSTGFMTHRALNVVRELDGIGLIDILLLKPLDTEKLYAALQPYQHVITIEEAFINNGGLDCLVANILNADNSTITLDKIGFNDSYVFELGSRDYLHKINCMHEEHILLMVGGKLRL